MRRGRAGQLTKGVEMIPLAEDEAAACRGGEDNPIRQLIDWVTGGNPRPEQWPPQML